MISSRVPDLRPARPSSGISFNDSTPPYDQWQVRWALALATDIKKVSLGTFAGMLRVSPLGVPPVTAVQTVDGQAVHVPPATVVGQSANTSNNNRLN